MAGSMLLGISLFGTSVQPFLLNNMSPLDPLGTLARVCFASSVLASYPLIFFNMRNWITSKVNLFYSKYGPKNNASPVKSISVGQVSAALLGAICFLATKFTDISFVGSLAGAIFGSNMMFIFPPLMYIRALQKKAKENNCPINLVTVTANSLLLLAGAALGIIGTYRTLTLR
eukprot:gene1065-1201_t